MNAASKGIQGDGKVSLVVSKQEFEAQQTEAGENLVRCRVRPKRSHLDARGKLLFFAAKNTLSFLA